MLLLISAALTSDAWACSFVGPEEFTPDTTLADTVAPSSPTLESLEIRRGTGPVRDGLGWMSTSCDDIGWINLALGAEDDQSTPSEMGVRVELIEGTLPDAFTVSDQIVNLTVTGDTLVGYSFIWIDGATDEQEAFDFDLGVYVLDQAGNESAEPLVVNIADLGSSGGRCSSGPVGGGAWVSLALALLLRRRSA